MIWSYFINHLLILSNVGYPTLNLKNVIAKFYK